MTIGATPHLSYKAVTRLGEDPCFGGYEQEFAFLIQRHHLRRLASH